MTSKPFPQIWVLEVENMEQRPDVGLVHGADVLLHPGPQHQVQLQEASLLAPVHQAVDEAAAALVGGEVDGDGRGVLLGGVGGGGEEAAGGGREEGAGGRGGEGAAELERPAEERGRHGNRGEEERWIAEEDDEATRMSREGKVSVTSNPGETATMNVPRSKRPDLDLAVDDFEEDEIDPELRYSFQRNSRFLKRVFTVDTLVKPLPPVMAYSVSRNVNFFFKIFTQFWDEEGIANAQRSLGLGSEDGSRRVR